MEEKNYSDHACKTKLAILEKSSNLLELRVNKHSDRLDLLEQVSAAREKEIANLIDQLKSTTSAIWWLIGIFFASYMGFFIWYIQGIKR